MPRDDPDDKETPRTSPSSWWPGSSGSRKDNSAPQQEQQHRQQPLPLIPLTAAVCFTLGLLTHRLLLPRFTRFPTAEHVPPALILRAGGADSGSANTRIRGVVASVGDSDNFRVRHAPFWMVGERWWWWARGNVLKGRQLTANTIHVRLAGIDAPESAFFGMPAQPHSAEAKAWLTRYLLHRHITLYPHRRDQYHRLICTAYIRRWWWFPFRRHDVSLEMVRAGWAVVYEAAGAEYTGGKEGERRLREAEAWARRKRVGMWKRGERGFVHPGEHKKKHLK